VVSAILLKGRLSIHMYDFGSHSVSGFLFNLHANRNSLSDTKSLVSAL
jgi:hypothetical protein